MAVFFLTAFFVCHQARGQFGLQGSYIAPSGNIAYYFKPALGVEAFYKTGKINSQLRFGFSAGYYNFKTTQDTLPTYAIDNGKRFLAGYTLVKQYDVTPLTFGVEYRISDARLTPFVGFDVNFFIIDYVHTTVIPNLYTSSDIEDTEWEFGALPKVGLTYKLQDNWLLSAGVGYSLGIVATADTQDYLKSFFSVCYYIHGEEEQKPEQPK